VREVRRTEKFSGKVNSSRMVRQRISMNHDGDHYSVGERGGNSRDNGDLCECSWHWDRIVMGSSRTP